MVEMVILPIILFVTWLIIKTLPWILAIMGVLLVIGLIVGRRQDE